MSCPCIYCQYPNQPQTLKFPLIVRANQESVSHLIFLPSPFKETCVLVQTGEKFVTLVQLIQHVFGSYQANEKTNLTVHMKSGDGSIDTPLSMLNLNVKILNTTKYAFGLNYACTQTKFQVNIPPKKRKRSIFVYSRLKMEKTVSECIHADQESNSEYSDDEEEEDDFDWTPNELVPTWNSEVMDEYLTRKVCSESCTNIPPLLSIVKIYRNFSKSNPRIIAEFEHPNKSIIKLDMNSTTLSMVKKYRSRIVTAIHEYDSNFK